MSDPYLGEIRMFAGNFAPRNWAFCDGQLLAPSQNGALFALLGTIYGGDGATTFALPDLRGRVPLHAGAGPGLSSRAMGERGGAESVTLTTGTIPSHNHAVAASLGGNSLTPIGRFLSTDPAGNSAGYNSSDNGSVLSSAALQPTGGNQDHPNMQPFLGVHFIIALAGIFPSRP